MGLREHVTSARRRQRRQLTSGATTPHLTRRREGRPKSFHTASADLGDVRALTSRETTKAETNDMGSSQQTGEATTLRCGYTNPEPVLGSGTRRSHHLLCHSHRSGTRPQVRRHAHARVLCCRSHQSNARLHPGHAVTPRPWFRPFVFSCSDVAPRTVVTRCRSPLLRVSA